MPNNVQSINSGQPELKDYYDPQDSTYEALKRKRKKKMEKDGILSQENDQAEFIQDPTK